MRGRGFTLIELVITLVVLSILAVGVSSYLGFGARLYSDVAEREQILGQSRFVAERIMRELRNAAPNSARVHQMSALIRCLEFTPVAASGVYSRLSVYPESGTELHLQLYNWSNSLLGSQLIVYPTEPLHYYSETDSHKTPLIATIQNAGELSAPENGATVKLQLNSAHSFAAHSPERRFYLLSQPVSFCFNGGEIRRLVGHNFNSGFPLPAHGVLMAQQVKHAEFLVQQAVLNRNAVVNLFLQFGSENNTDMFFNYEVHLPNVP